MHVNEKVLSFPTKYTLETADGQEVALHAHITLLRAHYTLETPNGDWDIHGDFVDHNYEMRCGDTMIATVHQKILSWGDCYEISVPTTAMPCWRWVSCWPSTASTPTRSAPR